MKNKAIISIFATAFTASFFFVQPLITNASYYGGYYNQPQQQIMGTCYLNDLNVKTGESVQWYASAYGGNNVFTYSWTGDEGLSGYGSTISKTYYTPGYKNAAVTIYSGNQHKTINCSSGVNVTQDDVHTQPQYPQYPQYPNYPNYNYLNVSCSSNSSYIYPGDSVRWTAYASGGNGGYSYTWSGTENLHGSDSNIFKTYSYSGQKTATVTVYSAGQAVTRTCSNSVTVRDIRPVYTQTPVYVQPSVYVATPVYNNVYRQTGLDIGCFADPSKISINQPVTWIVEVTGGRAPFTYSWTGSDNLFGSQSSVIKYYSTAGEKNAIVTVTSADGKTGTRACTNAVTVKKAVTTTVKKPSKTTTVVQTAPAPVETNGDRLSASSLFSLSNVPWGWVAILVILVLFATVLYLLFNRQKI